MSEEDGMSEHEHDWDFDGWCATCSTSTYDVIEQLKAEIERLKEALGL